MTAVADIRCSQQTLWQKF